MKTQGRSRWISLLLVGALLLAVVVASRGQAEAQGHRMQAPSGSASTRVLPPMVDPDEGEASALLYPTQSLPLRFDHALHQAKGIGCRRCHERAYTSDRVEDRLLPAGRVCDSCHRSDHRQMMQVRMSAGPEDGCKMCHVGYKAGDGNRVQRVVLPIGQIRFGHRVHVTRNIGCGQCHGAVQNTALATIEQLPRMRTCLRCHNLPQESRGGAKAACSTCHVTELSGQIRTKLGGGKLLPPRWMQGAYHGADYVHTHGPAAASNSRFCASCHSEDDCASCHDGRIRPRAVHPNDYLSMHAIEANQSAARCSSCHQQESFCKSCHMRAGVTMSGPSLARRAQGRMHPPPEVFTSGPVTGQHHAFEARRNLEACVGCHLERDCAVCHSTRGLGGGGIGMHPAGFVNRCAGAFPRNPRPCLVCHSPEDAELMRCR